MHLGGDGGAVLPGRCGSAYHSQRCHPLPPVRALTSRQPGLAGYQAELLDSVVTLPPDAPEPAPRQQPARKRRVQFTYRSQTVAWPRWELSLARLLEAKQALAPPEPADVEEQGRDAIEAPVTPHYEFPHPATLSPDNAAAETAWACYLQQWSDPAVHWPLVSDQQLTTTWEAALQQLGPSHVQGKVVLDLGAGPGLLSLLCAKAGARRVVAVEGNPLMARALAQVVEANGVGDVVQVINARVEQVVLAEKADVLVSNWAGPGLLGGGMLRSVAYARQALLKPGGLVLPSTAELFVTAIEDRAALVAAKAQWDRGTGHNLGAVMTQLVTVPRTSGIARQSQLCTDTCSLATLNLGDATLEAYDAGLQGMTFELTASRSERVFGLLLHFDLGFALPKAQPQQGGEEQVEQAVQGPSFTTDPRAPATHYTQLTLHFPRSVQLAQGEVLQGALNIQPTGIQGRDLQVAVAVSVAGVEATASYLLPHSMPAGAHAGLLAQAVDAAVG